MKHIRRWVRLVLTGLWISMGLITVCNLWIVIHTKAGIGSDLQQVSPRPYGLVLGTSPKQLNGAASAFFGKRVAAAALLYQHGKVKKLILSGTHDRQYYNEPLAMKEALVKLGVPEEAITLDIEGTNTLASITRAKTVLGIQEMIIITQRFHGYRALYISRHCGINASVFAAGEAASSVFSRTLLRELLARVKALIDLHVLQKHRFNNDEL